MTAKEMIDSLVDNAKANGEAHHRLVAHLGYIFLDAVYCEFHDFKNEKYAAPKMELVAQLENVIKNVKSGLYD